MRYVGFLWLVLVLAAVMATVIWVDPRRHEDAPVVPPAVQAEERARAIEVQVPMAPVPFVEGQTPARAIMVPYSGPADAIPTNCEFELGRLVCVVPGSWPQGVP